MSYHHRRADEADRRKEHRELQYPLEQEEESLHSPVRTPGFGGGGVPLLVVSDGSSGEESGECWMSNNYDNSSTSGWENSSIQALSQTQPPTAAPPSLPCHPTIEISPGVHVRLRGADETWKAVENDFYMPAECVCCESTIFCIQNADYILCPECRVVSRMEGLSSHGMGGVGLGFKYEDLARWQEAILRDS
jgi:hypothetical protein